MLVFLGFSLATLEYFPEDLLKTIFNIKFLAKMDSQLECMYIHFRLLNYQSTFYPSALYIQVSALY